MTNLINNLGYVWPAIFLGALIPCAILLALFLSKKRKEVAFSPVMYGFGTFFVVLIAVAVIMLIIGQMFLSSVTISGESDADSYLYIGGAVILLLFWLGSEFLKTISFETAQRAEKSSYAGLTFGCGFMLAQNCLIFGLIYLGEIDISQSLAFGLLMLISGLIYILISTVGHQLFMEKQRFAGSAIAISYFLMFAVMLIFANIYVTYAFIAAVLVFNLIVAYITLPLPFKKKKEGTV